MRSEFCKTKELVLIWWEFSIFIKTFVLRFINLFCRAYFKGNGETCTFWILMHFRNTVHDWYCFFFFFYNFKTQKFSIFCIFICYLITTFISFVLIVMSMPNNAFFIQYHFNSIPLHVIAALLDALTIGTIELMTSICFSIGLVSDGFILVLSFDIFLSAFAKMTDFQGNKDSSDIFLSDDRFPLRLSKPLKMLPLLFFQFRVFGSL